MLVARINSLKEKRISKNHLLYNQLSKHYVTLHKETHFLDNLEEKLIYNIYMPNYLHLVN